MILTWVRNNIDLNCSRAAKKTKSFRSKCLLKIARGQEKLSPGLHLFKVYNMFDHWAVRTGVMWIYKYQWNFFPSPLVQIMTPGIFSLKKSHLKREVWSSQTKRVFSGHKLKYRKFYLIVRKSYFTVRVIKCWNRLSEGVVASPSLEIFQTQQDTVLSNLL